MDIDKVTLQDLSFLQGQQPVFSLINRCVTQEGATLLRQHILHPPQTYQQLCAYQEAVKFWLSHNQQWPEQISNGTLVMVQKFYETTDLAIDKPNSISLFFASWMEKIFHKKAFSTALFSMGHLSDFIKGCQALADLLQEQPPLMIRDILEDLRDICRQPLARQIIRTGDQTTHKEWLLIGYQARTRMRRSVHQMIQLFARLDVQRSMALAGMEHGWVFPELMPAGAQQLRVQQLVHPLLKNPVSYDLDMNKQQRFLFLTGANMSGKSTLLYALGISALLAHLGMGVPAKAMRISFLDGLITNMHIEDNVVLGESYFFAEVQRMKLTAQRLQNNRHHLVLMDELFKGTNGYDAYECSYAVIKGLLNKSHNLMVLSTHLSELSEQLQSFPEIIFRYCQTKKDDQGRYEFTYQLKEGVSNDRIGFLVLKNEGVLDILNN
ncbi:MAG TPA: DNA mismatch repair protein MutS [Edaphocola sp.]|nr:DNA mismatch repair protein MutS [Edaphocola sp.]